LPVRGKRGEHVGVAAALANDPARDAEGDAATAAVSSFARLGLRSLRASLRLPPLRLLLLRKGRTGFLDQPEQGVGRDMMQMHRAAVLLVGHGEEPVPQMQFDAGWMVAASPAFVELAPIRDAHDGPQRGQIGAVVSEEHLQARARGRGLSVGRKPLQHIDGPRR
jgi:hypothetical protein